MKQRFYLATVLFSLLLSFALIFLEQNVSFFKSVNLKGRDIFFELRRLFSDPPSEIDTLLILHIDDESLQKIHQKWPYPRSIYAESLERLLPYHPKAIGFDVIFSGSDSIPEHDAAFSEKLKQSGNVVIAAHFPRKGIIGPAQALRQSAWKVGIVDKPKDKDGSIRRGFFWFSKRGEIFPSWEVAVLERAYGEKNLEKKGNYVINYQAQLADIPNIAFWRFLEGSILEKEIKNKIVLIGLTAEIFHDRHQTPLGSMPGIAINANALLTLLKKEFFTFISLPVKSSFYVMAVWLVVSVCLFEPFFVTFVLVGVMIFVFILCSFLLFLSFVGFDLWLLSLVLILLLAASRVFRTAVLYGLQIQVVKNSSKDSTTGCYSKQFLDAKLNYEWFYLFLNSFRKGHLSLVALRLAPLSENALVDVIEIIQSSIRKQELICKHEVGKICIVLPHTRKEEAELFSKKIERILERLGAEKGFRFSIAVASVSNFKRGFPKDVLKEAEEKLGLNGGSSNN